MPGKTATNAGRLGLAVLMGALAVTALQAAWGRLAPFNSAEMLHFVGTHAVAALRGELLVHPDGFTLAAAALLLGVAVWLRSAQ